MIAYLKGTLTYKSPTDVIIDINGVGYMVHISLHTYEQIQQADSCQLYTYFHVKEDAHTLYGFWDVKEKLLFIQLISVSGVGPNTARMMLSALSPGEIQGAIMEENEKLLQKIKGIGAKSAKRIILELKDKVAKTYQQGDQTVASKHNTKQDDALSALVALGIPKAIAQKALDKVAKGSEEVKSVEQLVKSALQLL